MPRRPLVWFFMGVIVAASVARAAEAVKWETARPYRVLVEAPPVDLKRRESDELVARFDFDLSSFASTLAAEGSIDLDSIQIMRYDAASGLAVEYANHAYGQGKFDRPFQFYDAAHPANLLDYQGYPSLDFLNKPAKLRTLPVPWGSRHFNAVGSGQRGQLVWPHTQQTDRASHYAIYFDLLPPGQLPRSSPAGFVGDGSSRHVRESSYMGPPGNVRGQAVDWNDDGLADILFGSSAGQLVVYLNGGQPGQPAFGEKRLLLDADGTPIDVGYDTSPCVADLNGDGRKDLLVGAHKGCVAYYENIAPWGPPRLKYVGLLQSQGKLILTPAKPIAEGRGEEVFRDDYMPNVGVADWDGDGDIDLLLGGYVTGLVFYYENTGRDDQGRPQWTARGALQTEGKSIDVGWAAAPVAADLDDDGDLDLICGSQPTADPRGGEKAARRSLFYFENTGTRTQPKLVERPFPSSGALPFGGYITPSVIDWNGDNVLDLVLVGHNRRVYFLKNLGSRAAPRFDLNTPPTGAAWQLEPLPFGSFLDFNADGFADVQSIFSVYVNSGKPLPGFVDRRIDFRAGKAITHPVPHGDENPGILLDDFDGDGDLDGLYGAHSGHIWWHQNRGTNAHPDLDAEGRKLALVDGTPLKVGLPEGAKVEFNFSVLQGARPRPVPGDFNGDGRKDLIIGDTYGKVRYFENRGTSALPVFAEPVLIDDRRSRIFLASLDYNADGRLDLLVLKGRAYLLLNKGEPGECAFHPPRALNLPEAIGYILSVGTADYNRDGDEDLIYTSGIGCCCFAERSFLEHGYRQATFIKFEIRPAR